jgi:hypothetical protein
MGCQRCIFYSAPTKIMVPWYTVEPPTNGLCPKHCRCVVDIIDNDVQASLQAYYETQVLRITDQAERLQATKESLLHYASTSYWEGKADLLQIPHYLMDILAPLPPCVAHIVARQLDGMLEDFNDLEEWFFAFKKAPSHEKQTILEGYEDGSYTATLKRRRKDRATDHALTEPDSVPADPLPLFGSPSKKFKQTTLTQDYQGLPVVPVVQPVKPAVIDLTDKLSPQPKDRTPEAVFDPSSRRTESSKRSPARMVHHASQPKASPLKSDLKPPSAIEFRFKTPPPHQKKDL